MAENTGRKRGAAKKTDDDDKPTPRVVLKRERVLVLPDSLPPGSKIDAGKLGEALGIPKAEAAKLVNTDEAWVQVKLATGSKNAAIETFAGKPGTPEAKPGVYKAPSESAMRGGRAYETPAGPLARSID